MSHYSISEGVSVYDKTTVYDRDIANLIGINTYSSLYHHDPDLWYKVVDPMPSPDIMIDVINELTVDGYTDIHIKKELVKYAVTGKCIHGIRKLVGSSPPPSWFWYSTVCEVLFIIFQFVFLIYVVWLLFYFDILNPRMFMAYNTRHKIVVEI
jgi:hypothetical protein